MVVMSFYDLVNQAAKNLEGCDITTIKRALGGVLESNLRSGRYKNADILLKMLADFEEINRFELYKADSRGKYACRITTLNMVRDDVAERLWSDADKGHVYMEIDELEGTVKKLKAENRPSSA